MLGQAHTLSHLMKTLIQDSTIYFFVMLTFNAGALAYAVVARGSLKNFPLVCVPCFTLPYPMFTVSCLSAGSAGLPLCRCL